MLGSLLGITLGCSLFALGVHIGKTIEEFKYCKSRKTGKAYETPTESQQSIIDVQKESEITEYDLRHAEYDERISRIKEELRNAESGINIPGFFDYTVAEENLTGDVPATIVTATEELIAERKAGLR